MKRKFVVLCFTLFTFAAISLVIIQIVQTRRASEISDNLFNISIDNAMDAAILQLEQEIQPKSIGVKNQLEPIDFTILDSIISDELIVNGVDIKPDVAILDSTQQEVLFCSNPARQQQMLESAYKYTYHPHGNKSIAPYYITLHFSSRALFIKQNNTFYNLLSGFLLAVISVIFGISFRVIINQRKVDAMKTDFISNMTHEIKTPIATISLACEMLQDDSISTDESQRKNFLSIISDENRRMRILIETILQSAKMGNKNFALNLTLVDINKLVDEVCSSFQLSITNLNGSIVKNICELPATIYADSLHISNLIHNLVDNAIKYSDGAPCISISTNITNNMVQLIVSDKGIGIAKEDQKHVFEKFYRVSTGNVHNVKGFGIGLNYVAQVVRLHHGNIALQSELGQGTTFTISIPYMP